MLLGARKVHCDFTADGQLTMPFICEVDASIGAITSHIVKFDLGHRLVGEPERAHAERLEDVHSPTGRVVRSVQVIVEVGVTRHGECDGLNVPRSIIRRHCQHIRSHFEIDLRGSP